MVFRDVFFYCRKHPETPNVWRSHSHKSCPTSLHELHLLTLDAKQLSELPVACWHCLCWCQSYKYLTLLDGQSARYLALYHYNCPKRRPFLHLSTSRKSTSTLHIIRSCSHLSQAPSAEFNHSQISINWRCPKMVQWLGWFAGYPHDSEALNLPSFDTSGASKNSPPLSDSWTLWVPRESEPEWLLPVSAADPNALGQDNLLIFRGDLTKNQRKETMTLSGIFKVGYQQTNGDTRNQTGHAGKAEKKNQWLMTFSNWWLALLWLAVVKLS